jgi:hypothetical protein
MVAMKPRSVLTVLLLATAVPILLVVALGLETEATNFNIGTFVSMSLFQAGILAGIVLTAVGTLHSRKSFTVVGSAFLLAESIPLLVDGLFVFALLPATISLVLLSVKPKEELSTIRW